MHFDAPAGAAADFVAKVIDLSLLQLVSMPTRGCNIIDLALTNDPLPFLFYSMAAPSSTSDHNSLILHLAFRQESLPAVKSFNFTKADYHKWSIRPAPLY